jgi:hypothetical protein
MLITSQMMISHALTNWRIGQALIDNRGVNAARRALGRV